MTAPLSSAPYKGTRDFYPQELAYRNYIFETWRTCLSLHGFVEYETSVLEQAEIYIQKSGAELGGSQLYNFHDKGGRFVALRPEQTPSLARIIAHKYGELRFPLRWFSIPNCFRYERPQKGRMREHWQLNVDIVGLSAGYVELELFYVLGNIFKSFGANSTHFKILFNHRGVLDDWLLCNQLQPYAKPIYAVLDDWFKTTKEEKITQLSQVLSMEQVQLVLELENPDSLSYTQYIECASKYNEIQLLLDTISLVHPDLEFTFSPFIIRGIAYYTGIVFEAFDKNPHNPRALFGGGRYDDLMTLFGKQASAIGFGMGDVTMHEFLSFWNLYPPSIGNTIEKIGLLPLHPESVSQLYQQIIPQLKAEGKTWDIDYDFDRKENKRYETLKKRGCTHIVSV